MSGITDSMDMNLSKPQELVIDMETWHAAVHGVSKHWTRQSDNSTELKADFGHFGPCVFSRLTTTSEELGLFALEGIRNK